MRSASRIILVVVVLVGCEPGAERARNRFAKDVAWVRDAERLASPVRLVLPRELADARRAAAASRIAFLAVCESCAPPEWCEDEARRIEHDPDAARERAACP
jgi:hypothetical protein